MKAKKCKYPFTGYVFYKQYLPNGRCYYYLYNKELGKRRLISRARYRMSVHLGRRLKRWEHVDHRDEDKTNDRLSNLQILTQAANNQKSVLARGKNKKFIRLSCVVCATEFERTMRLHRMRMKEGNLPTCSKSCGGKVPKLRREGLL